MADVDWKCLIIHAVVTVVTFLVVVRFWLYAKKENGDQPQIKVDDYTLYGAVLLSFLVGYLVIILMKLDCLNYPVETKEETNRRKENFGRYWTNK
jgi:outer membrane phospholipase A